jgi:hypothetical protein
VKVAAKHPELERIGTLIPDSAMRYFSGPLFGERVYVDIPDREATLDPESRARLDEHAHRLEVLH